MREVKTEFNCFDCDRSIKIKLDMSLDEDHEVLCPRCSHPHYVTRDGEITDEKPVVKMRLPPLKITQFSYNTYTASSSSTSSMIYIPFIGSSTDSTI